MGLNALKKLADGAMQTPPDAEHTVLELPAGSRMEMWETLINQRLVKDNGQIFLTRRGGSTVLNTSPGNDYILTIKGFQSQVLDIVRDYLAVHCDNGSVYLYDIVADSFTLMASGFSTTEPIQIIDNNRFVYFFDYSFGSQKYYDILTDTSSLWLSYEHNYITGHSFPDDEVAYHDDEQPNIFNFKAGELALFFPTFYSENSLGQPTPHTMYKAGAGVYRYDHNDGDYYTDENGVVYDFDAVFVFRQGESKTLTLTEVGTDGELFSAVAPTKGNEVYYRSYLVRILDILESGENTIITFAPEDSTIDTIFYFVVINKTGGRGALLPYNSELFDAYNGIQTTYKVESGEIVENTEYIEPTIHKAYVIVDVLDDGSITIPGKPYLISIGMESLFADNVLKNVELTINTSSSANVTKRYVCSTKWLPEAELAFDPTNDNFPNSAFFINKEIETDETTFLDRTPDKLLIRPITELVPMNAGITGLFGPNQISTNSIEQVSGSLLIGGYQINRPLPDPYTNPSAATNENIYVDLQSTSQLSDDVRVSFQFEYTDGKKSEIVDTEEYLQEGTVTLGLFNAQGNITVVQAASPEVAAAEAYTAPANITVTGAGDTVDTGFTLVVSSTVPSYENSVAIEVGDDDQAVALKIETLVNGDANFTFDCVNLGATIYFIRESEGTAGNSGTVTLRESGQVDLTGTDVSCSVNPASFGNGVDGQTGAEGDMVIEIGGATELSYEVQYGDTKVEIANGLSNYLNMNSSDYSSTVDTSESDPVITVTALLPGSQYEGEFNVATDTSNAAVTYDSGGVDGSVDYEARSANRIEIHSLNALVSKIFILGRVVDGGTSYHLLKTVAITDPEAHGLPVSLPNTSAGLADLLAVTYDEPASDEVLENPILQSYISIGLPPQQLLIASQKQIRDNSAIQNLLKEAFDIDKTRMRYKIWVFTDQNIQIGYYVEDTTVSPLSGQITTDYEADFEMWSEKLSIRSKFAVSRVKKNIFIQAYDGIYSLADEKSPFISNGDEPTIANNLIRNIVFNEKEDEIWFVAADNTVVIYDLEFNAIRNNNYDTAPNPGDLRFATAFKEVMYAGFDDSLVVVDDVDVSQDYGTTNIIGQAILRSLGTEFTKAKILEVVVGGQSESVRVDIDRQFQRLERNTDAWDSGFDPDYQSVSAQIYIHGRSFQIHNTSIMPKVRFLTQGSTIGFISHLAIKYVLLDNKGKARI